RWSWRPDRHEAAHVETDPGRVRDDVTDFRPRTSGPMRVIGEVHLHEDRGTWSAARDLVRDRRAVDRVPEMHERGERLDLVPLDRADEVPADIQDLGGLAEQL